MVRHCSLRRDHEIAAEVYKTMPSSPDENGVSLPELIEPSVKVNHLVRSRSLRAQTKWVGFQAKTIRAISSQSGGALAAVKMFNPLQRPRPQKWLWCPCAKELSNVR